MTERSYIDNLIAVFNNLSIDAVIRARAALTLARISKKSVYLFGNGGSGSTASHFTSDLNKGAINGKEPRFKAVCLNDNVPALTAWANDSGYNDVFSEQVRNFVSPGDVVVGISGSGNSMNVLDGIHAARDAGAITIGITGFDGGKLKDSVDIVVLVNSDCMEIVEDVHLALCHSIAVSLRRGGQQ